MKTQVVGYSAAVAVELSEIDAELRPASQMRVKLDEEAIQTYAEELDELPPVTLMYDHSTESHWLVDGCHTIHAAQVKKRKRVQARVKPGSYLDAFAEAAVANRTNGVHETNADKQHRVEIALEDPVMREWTNNRIATACSVAHSMVTRYRPEPQLDSESNSNSIPKRVGKDGKRYPARKRRKAKKKPAAVPTQDQQPPIPEGDDVRPPPDTEHEDDSLEIETTPESVAPRPSRNGDGAHDLLGEQPGATGMPTTQIDADGSTPSVSEPEIIPAIDWVSRWDDEEKLLTARFHAWPEEMRKLFAVKNLMFARKLAALYPDILDRTDEYHSRKVTPHE